MLRGSCKLLLVTFSFAKTCSFPGPIAKPGPRDSSFDKHL